MYTQALDQMGKEHLHTASADHAALEARFQQRVDADERIEPKDWMPDGKRGDHGEHLGHLLAPMQHLQRTCPGASW